MYSSYGSFKRLGLRTSSHVEPKMTKAEWMNAYGTANNIRLADAPRRPRLERPRPPQRTESSAAAVSQMVASAHALRQRNESSRAATQARSRQRQEAEAAPTAGAEQEQEEQEAVDWDSDDNDDVDADDEPSVQSGIQREARADRRLQQLRAQHRAEQGRQRRKKEKTRRTPTLKRSTSDVVISTEAAESPQAEPDATALPLPSLGAAAVGDVRQRTRLLLREALMKADQQTQTAAAEAEKRVYQSADSPAQKKRKREEHSEEKQPTSAAHKDAEAEADKTVAAQGEEEEEEDEYALLASDVEQHLFEHHQLSATTAYRQHSRSIIFALVHNLSLTASLLSLSLSPLQLIGMQTQQLASHQRQQQRQQEQLEMRRELVLKGAAGYRSEEWQCEGCGCRQTECWVLKEQRDLRKVEVWGGGGDETHSLLLVRCCDCKREWKKEL